MKFFLVCLFAVSILNSGDAFAAFTVSTTTQAATPHSPIIRDWKESFQFYVRTHDGFLLTGGTYTTQNNNLVLNGHSSVLHTITLLPDQSVEVSHSGRRFKFDSVADFYEATGSDKRANYDLAQIHLAFLSYESHSSSRSAVRNLRAQFEIAKEKWRKRNGIEEVSETYGGIWVYVDQDWTVTYRIGVYEVLGEERGRKGTISIKSSYPLFGELTRTVSLKEIENILKNGKVTSEIIQKYAYSRQGEGVLEVQFEGETYLIDWVKTYQQAGTLQVFVRGKKSELIPLGFLRLTKDDKFMDTVDELVASSKQRSCDGSVL